MESLSISLTATGIALVALTVAIHSAGTFLILIAFVKYRSGVSDPPRFSRLTARVTSVVMALLLLHLLEVGLWAALFQWAGCFPDFRTSVYFSLITYATVGYGDVVLNGQYRMLGGIEALVGVLMMSWSTALLIGYVHWVYSDLIERWSGGARRPSESDPDRL